MPINVENERSLASVMAELRDEVKDFLSTRVAMLQSEMKDKIAAWKTALPMIVIGLVLAATAFLLLTGAIVGAIYVAFAGNPWAAAISLAIVGIAYALFGGIAVLFAIRDIKERGVTPARTMRVLKDDQVWLRNEAKVQL